MERRGVRRYWLHRVLVRTKRSARLSPGRSPFPARGRLRKVVADVAEDVLKLTAQEDHGNDDSDGDDSNDECVFHQSLAFVVTEECEHFSKFLLSSMFSRRTVSRSGANNR